MAAVFNVTYDFGGTNGTPGTQQNVDSLGPPCIRYKTADDGTIDTANPIPIPAAGTKYSYWKNIYLKCATAPATQVDNVKFYTDGSGFGTGIDVMLGLQFPTKNSGSNAGYEVALGTPGDTGTELVAGHTGITSSASAYGYTSGAPLSLSISEAGSIINAIGETCNYLLMQMNVINTAASGNLLDETFTFSYDEI